MEVVDYNLTVWHEVDNALAKLVGANLTAGHKVKDAFWAKVGGDSPRVDNKNEHRLSK